MFNFTLYKRGLIGSWKILLIFTAVITMYYAMIIPMFDPKMGETLAQLMESMPELMAMFGMDASSTTLLGFLASYLYGFIMLVLPMVISILCTNKLITRHIDRGSMVYLVASPVKRSTVAFTQMAVIISGLAALMIFITILGLIVCSAAFPRELEIGRFILLNTGVLALQLFIAGICFLCACAFNDTKLSTGLGAGIPVLGFIIQMMANQGEQLKFAKYLTFFTLFNPSGLIDLQAGAIWGMIVLLLGAATFFVAGITIFCKKDLHI